MIDNSKYLKERAERYILVRKLRDSGMKWKEVAKEMGVSVARVNTMYMYDDNDVTESVKEEIRLLHKNCCGICTGETNLHTHHIEGKKGHSIENLVLLCRECHSYVHRIKRKNEISYKLLMDRAKAARLNGKKGGRKKLKAK